MAKTLQFRRGTTSELSAQTGAVGELFVDTQKDTVVVMDGSTAGGFPLQRELLSGTNIKTVNGQSVLGSGDITIAGGSGVTSYNDLSDKPTFKTINNQSILGSGNISITSGSGSSFDQELNTTDDVVFGSALVGDVSIVGNTISSIDTYGNVGTLTIDGDLEVTKQISNTALQLTANWTAPQNLSTGSYIATYAPGDPNCYIHTYSTSRDFMDWMLARAYGGVVSLEITMNSIVYTGTVTLAQVQDQVDSLPFFISAATGDLLNVFNGANSGFVGLVRVYKEENVTTVSTINPLSVTETGVNVEGTFTVNGQPVGGGGSSYNQSLNTTDDVVFNSVETRALDVYINDNSTTNYELQNDMGYFQNYPWSRYIEILNYSGFNTNIINYVLSKHSGDVINFNINTMFGNSIGYGVLSSVQNYGSFAYVYFSSIVITSGPDLYYNGTSLYSPSKLIDQYLFETRPLSVDRNGVVLSGITTADDIVANSALIGDISIIGNNISAHDPYGNAHVLSVSASDVVFDTNLNLEVNTLVETTETVTADFNMMRSFNLSNSLGTYFTYNGSSNWSDSSKFVTGCTVTINSMGMTTVIQLTSDMTYDMMYGWRAAYTLISGTEMIMAVVSVIVENSSGDVANYGFDDQGTFTAPAISTDSALIGSVSVTGNMGELVVDGDLSVKHIAVATVDNTEIIPSAAFFYHPAAAFGAVTFLNLTPEQYTKFDNVQPGDMISFITMYNGQEYQGKFTFTEKTYNVNQINFGNVTFSNWSPAGDLTQIIGWFDYPTNVIAYVGTEQITTTYTPYNAIEVTESGVNVEGILTVNGQQVGGSSDQSLNTTDDVVFNSALIGDVSIVGNTISGVDSYGNPNPIVVDGEFSVIKSSEFVPYQFTYDGVNVGQMFYYTNTGLVYIEVSLISTNQQDESNLLSMNVGDIFVFDNPSYEQTTLTLTSNFSLDTTSGYGGPAGVYIATVDKLNPFGNYATESQYVLAKIKSAEITPLSVTETGVNVNGALTVNGQPVGGSGYQPIGITQLPLDSTNVLSMIIVGEVKSGLGIFNDPNYTGSDPVSIVLPTGLDGQKLTIFNSSTNTCTILNAYSVSNAPSANAIAPQSVLNLLHVGSGNWYIC